MQSKQPGAFRRFVQSPVGRALIPLIAILVVFATYVYVSTLLAIPAILVFGLALPIWGGLKRPRYLALTGLAIILIVAPLSTVAITQEIRTPVGFVSSASTPSINATNGTGPVLLNAQVTPYTGGSSTVFNWTVTVQPQYVPGPGGLLGLSLFISTCPGAIVDNSSLCSPGYPFFNVTQNFTGADQTTSHAVSFNFQIGGVGIWEWQMGAFYRNATAGNQSYIYLVGDPTFDGIEGPVVGTWVDTFSELLPTVYLNGLLLLALPFYIVLLLYVYFKRRESRKQETARRAAGPTPTDAPPTSGPPGPGAPPAAAPVAVTPSAAEKTCPNCKAVVYANEAVCWKCGASLSSGSNSTPLPSSKS